MTTKTAGRRAPPRTPSGPNKVTNMTIIHTRDPETGETPPHIKALPKLEMLRANGEQRMATAAENISMEVLIAAFNSGYEARKAEEKE